MKPVGFRVLVKPDRVEEKKGSLYIPQIAQDRLQKATVWGELIAIGATCWKPYGQGERRGLPWAKVGDRILYEKYAGAYVTPDEDTIVLNDSDVLGVYDASCEGHVRACGNALLVRPKPIEEAPKGLYIPDEVRDKELLSQTQGTVLSVGTTAWANIDDGDPWADVGSNIVFAKWAGYEFKEKGDGEVLRILSDKDVLAVIE